MINLTQREIHGIPYFIRNSKNSRKVLVSIHENGNVIVSKPARVPLQAVEQLLDQKIQWIQETIAKQKSRPQKLLAHYSAKDFKDHKEKARERAHKRLVYFNRFYNYKIGAVYIRNQKSRWGSCSSKGNLNFNYKIVFLPHELADYIIVHELCHIQEMNHSKRFWTLVAQQIPNYEELQKILKKY
jgi:predicted metal-dependent hydrolase